MTQEYPNFAFKKGYGVISIYDKHVNIKLSSSRDMSKAIDLNFYKGTTDFRMFIDWLRSSYNTQMYNYSVIVAYGGDTRYVKMCKLSRQGKTLFMHELEITDADAEALAMMMLGLSEY